MVGQGLGGGEAVSYTHLDVYKRQVYTLDRTHFYVTLSNLTVNFGLL